MGQYADHVDFIAPGADGGRSGERRITAWTWKPLPEPVLASLSLRGQAWEMTRYQDYEAHLQDRTTGEIFGRSAAFLKLAAARATAPAETLAAPGQLSETSRSASDGR
jgi:hypothetical protein